MAGKFNPYANRVIDLDVGGNENYGAPDTNISFSRGPADPHSNRSIGFEAMQDPGVHEGIGVTANKGAFKGPQDQKNT